MRLRRVVIDLLCWVRQWGPITHAVYYVETDGTRQLAFRQRRQYAIRWAQWCLQDGCTEVVILPLYTEQEIGLIAEPL